MKKRMLAMTIMFAVSLTVFTGCGNDKKETMRNTKTEAEAVTESDEYEAPENSWKLTKEEREKYPENTVFIAPPLDADGNYPEGFDPDEYEGALIQEEPEVKDSEAKDEE